MQFFLIVKNVIKNQKFNSPQKLCDICKKKMLRNKIVRYKFYIKHSLIGITVFLINIKNALE